MIEILIVGSVGVILLLYGFLDAWAHRRKKKKARKGVPVPHDHLAVLRSVPIDRKRSYAEQAKDAGFKEVGPGTFIGEPAVVDEIGKTLISLEPPPKEGDLITTSALERSMNILQHRPGFDGSVRISDAEGNMWRCREPENGWVAESDKLKLSAQGETFRELIATIDEIARMLEEDKDV